MKVKLLKYTNEPEKIVAFAAKLCYSPSDIERLEEKVGKEEIKGFVQKLVEMGHESPLEHASYTFGIEGISRVTSHQLVRHRLASYSQQSQRYVKEDQFEYITPQTFIEAGLESWYKERMRIMQKWYNKALEVFGEKLNLRDESANQDARYLLPNATETKIIVTMNARELIYFFKKRTCNRAQWEIRNLAKEMLKRVYKVSPNIFRYAGPSCLYDRCYEGKMSCGLLDKVKREFEDIRKE